MSPRVTDERRIKHEESLAGDAPQPPGRSDVPQFTLRGLLTFFTAITICLSLGVTAERVIQVVFGLGLLLLGLSAILTWIVLCVTYRRLHLRLAFVVHLVGPALAVGFALLVGIVATAGDPSGMHPHPAALLYGLFTTLYYGCVLGSVLSVPVFVVSMVVLLLRAALRRPR